MRLVIFLLSCLLATSIAANGSPAISPENVDRLTELRRIGGEIPGEFVWSPDGSLLAVGTSSGVHIYDTDDFTEIALLSDAGPDVAFIKDRLVSAGDIWDVTAQQFIKHVGDTTNRFISPSEKHLVIPEYIDRKLNVRVWDVSEAEIALAANFDMQSDWRVWNVVFSPDESRVVMILLPTAKAPATPVWPPSVQLCIFWYETCQALDLGNDVHEIEAVGFNADGSLLVTSAYNVYPHGMAQVFRLWSGGGDLYVSWENSSLTTKVSFDHTLVAGQDLIGERIDLLWNGKPAGLFNAGSPYTWLGRAPFFSDDRQYMISPAWGWGYQLSVRDQELGYIVQEKIYDLGSHIRNIRFSPDNRFFFVEYWDKPATLWSVETVEPLDELPSNLAFDPVQPRAVYWGDSQPNPTILDLDSGEKTTLPVIQDYDGRVLEMDTQANRVIFASPPPIFDLTSGEKVFELPAASYIGAAFKPDGSEVAVIEQKPDEQCVVTVWQQAENEVVEKFQIQIGSCFRPEKRIHYSPDGSLIAIHDDSSNELDTGGTPGVTTLVDIAHGTFVQFDNGTTGTLSQAFVLTGQFLLSAGYYGDMGVWNVSETLQREKTGKYQRPDETKGFSSLIHFPNNILQIATTATDNYVAAGELYQTWLITPHNLVGRGGNMTYPVSAQDIPHTLLLDASSPVFSNDGRYLVVQETQASRARVIETATLAEFTVASDTDLAAFSPDDRLLVTATGDGIALWNLAAPNQPVRMLLAPKIPVQNIAFSSDGTQLYIQDESGVSVWGVE